MARKLRDLGQNTRLAIRLNSPEAAEEKRNERRARASALAQFNSDFKLVETECDDDQAPHRLHDFGTYFQVRSCGLLNSKFHSAGGV